MKYEILHVIGCIKGTVAQIPLHIIVVGEPRIEEPNLRIYFFNSSKERQMNYKDYAHPRRIKDLVGSCHSKKSKVFRPRPFIEL